MFTLIVLFVVVVTILKAVDLYTGGLVRDCFRGPRGKPLGD